MFTYVPLIFLPSLIILSYGIFPDSYENFYKLLNLFIYIWVFYLQLIVLRYTFELKPISAIFLYITPVVLFYIFIFSFGITSVLNFIYSFL